MWRSTENLIVIAEVDDVFEAVESLIEYTEHFGYEMKYTIRHDLNTGHWLLVRPRKD